MTLSALDIDELVKQNIEALINDLSYQELYVYLVHKHMPQALANAINGQINDYYIAQEQRVINELVNRAYQQQQQEDEQEARDDAAAQQVEMEQRNDYSVQRQALFNSMDMNNSLQQAQLAFFNRLLIEEFPRQQGLRQQRMRERQARYEAEQRNDGEFARLSASNYRRLERDLQPLVRQTEQTIHQSIQNARDASHAIYVPILDRALNEQQLAISIEERQILVSIRGAITYCAALELEKQQLTALIVHRSDRVQQLRQHLNLEHDLLMQQDVLQQQDSKAAARVFNASVAVAVNAVLLAIPAVIGLVTASLSLGLIIPAALLLTSLVALIVYTFAFCEPHRRAVRQQLEDNEHSLRLNKRALMPNQGDKLVNVPDLTYQIDQEQEAIVRLQSQLNEKDELLNAQYSQQSPAGYSARLFCSQQIRQPSAPPPEDDELDDANCDDNDYGPNY